MPSGDTFVFYLRMIRLVQVLPELCNIPKEGPFLRVGPTWDTSLASKLLQ